MCAAASDGQLAARFAANENSALAAGEEPFALRRVRSTINRGRRLSTRTATSVWRALLVRCDLRQQQRLSLIAYRNAKPTLRRHQAQDYAMVLYNGQFLCSPWHDSWPAPNTALSFSFANITNRNSHPARRSGRQPQAVSLSAQRTHIIADQVCLSQ